MTVAQHPSKTKVLFFVSDLTLLKAISGRDSIGNIHKTLHPFKNGIYPKGLFQPIKFDINEVFFEAQFHFDNFKVESKYQFV